MSQGSPVKYGPTIELLLKAVHSPAKVAIMHCKAHQHGHSPVQMGNRRADKAAKEAAGKQVLLLLPRKQQNLETKEPKYTPEDDKLAEVTKAKKNYEGRWVTPTNQVIVTQELMRELAERKHAETHWGIESLIEALKPQVISVRMTGIVKSIVQRCELCLKNNPQTCQRLLQGITRRGNSPGDYWQIDFSELPRQNGYW
ncbi:protein NYNRIN-like [Grus japonensis]|uniref:Protein NYNRIN-like n=1 Tax=Grus japonensis TaxID=30415 RepID=A0ABC9YF15_GRUJA